MVFLRSLVAALGFIIAPVTAVFTAAQLASSIDGLSTIAQGLQPTANSITVLNAPLIVVGLGPYPVCCPAPANS